MRTISVTRPSAAAPGAESLPAAGQLPVRPTGLRCDPWQLLLDIVIITMTALEGFRLAQNPSPAVLALLVLGGGCGVLVRRRAPMVSLVLAGAVSLLYPMMTGNNLFGWVLLEASLLSFAILATRTQAIYATAGVGILLMGQALLTVSVSIYDPLALALIAWTAAAGGVGSAVSAQRAYVLSLEDQARRAVTTREAVVARHVVEERLRIARELHDVMAHHIAAINVHAGSAEANLPASAEHSRDALVHIRQASGGALQDLQSILHLLRSDGHQPPAHAGDKDTPDPGADYRTVPGVDYADSVPVPVRGLVPAPEPDTAVEALSPTPGARQIPALIDSFTLLGMAIRLHGIPPQDLADQLPGPLPPAADLACYRVMQEGLTNAHRYGLGHTAVRFTATATALSVSLTNTPRTSPDPRDEARGHFGLVGMQERVSSAGGHLEIRQTRTEFTLTATLPLGTPS